MVNLILGTYHNQIFLWNILNKFVKRDFFFIKNVNLPLSTEINDYFLSVIIRVIKKIVFKKYRV